MKATLEFVMPEDQAEFNDAVSGADMRCILLELVEHCRRQGEREGLSTEAAAQWDEMRIYVFEACRDRNVVIE